MNDGGLPGALAAMQSQHVSDIGDLHGSGLGI
jgi:hypothetical protein